MIMPDLSQIRDDQIAGSILLGVCMDMICRRMDFDKSFSVHVRLNIITLKLREDAIRAKGEEDNQDQD